MAARPSRSECTVPRGAYLTEPATTDAQTLGDRMAVGVHAKPRKTVVFSTFKSIDVIRKSQDLALDEHDLVIS